MSHTGHYNCRCSDLYAQYRELTGIRQDDHYWGGVSVGIGRGVLSRLDRARKAFYRRCKSGEKVGYPRFRASRRWKTIEIAEPTAAMVTKKTRQLGREG